MRYNRGSVQDTLRVAKALAQQTMKTYYIYPTAYGLTIEEAPPPFGLQHYQVTATRTFYLGERVASQPAG